MVLAGAMVVKGMSMDAASKNDWSAKPPRPRALGSVLLAALAFVTPFRTQTDTTPAAARLLYRPVVAAAPLPVYIPIPVPIEWSNP